MQLLILAYSAMAGRLIKTSHSDGLPLSARWIRDAIRAQEEK
jgi:hypothetical protein